MTRKFDLKFSIDEDALIRGLLDSKGKRVEIIAFGIVYTGKLESVDPDNGTLTIVDDEDKAMLEIERVESLSILES
ncbi:MAG: hypothetical protein ABH871_03725 [Pseudomonadota bacterium]